MPTLQLNQDGDELEITIVNLGGCGIPEGLPIGTIKFPLRDRARAEHVTRRAQQMLDARCAEKGFLLRRELLDAMVDEVSSEPYDPPKPN